LAYLLGEFIALRQVGPFNRIRLGYRLFGRELLDEQMDKIRKVLAGWSYAYRPDGQGRARNRLPTALVSAVVCGAGLLTGLTAVEFGTSAARIMGALLSLVALGVFAAVAWAASSRSR
jgi:hypothetical protein